MEFSNKDVIDYYDQTEVHYRMFWGFEQAMGLHYGLWDKDTKSVGEAILNVNKQLADKARVTSADRVLDAGCGVGGTCIYLAQKYKCKTVGITLSKKQVETANGLAKKRGVDEWCDFQEQDYTNTNFEDNSFDIVFAIESFGTAQNKELFFKEMRRILKPNGRIVMADTLKPMSYNINNNKAMKTMLNGWAIADILAVDEITEMAKRFGFENVDVENVSLKVKKSVKRIYYAALVGMVGTKLYNIFYNASKFSKIHYKTGLAQKKAFDAGDWGYYLLQIS